ncbi:hypothetical protein DVT68_00275 [Dyella solisilvae]|uniref:ATP-binding protein n=2 Tax=Dyella solisilvae TaxID=1920168 RepID=A0A370K9L1_9GAMM|nr:hypothetical protein DVT68_00275 [Dyella solisilvae]
MLRERRPMIFTRPAERLATDCKNSLEIGANAIWLQGFARFGKTFGARQLVQSTRWRPFPMYIAEYSYTRPTKPNEGYFSSGLLEQHGQVTAKTALSVNTVMRYTRMLREQALRHGAVAVGLVFNEANRFTVDEYENLLTIDNELEKYLRTFHILINQCDASRYGPAGIDKRPPRHLFGRYFTTTHNYTGLLWDVPEDDKTHQTLSDVALAFREYDELLTWPQGSGISYTQYFARKAYASGWRLGTQIDSIRKVIEDVRAEHGLGPVHEWPMQTFEHFVYFVLVRIAGDNPDFTCLTESEIRNALMRACYLHIEPDFQGDRE